MAVMLKAAARLKASLVITAAESEWFESLTRQQQADYLEDHPDSKFNKHKSVVNNRPLSTEDRRRIVQLKNDIKQNEEDVRDFEEDGDTEWAEKTRKLVERSKAELKALEARN